MLRAKRICRCWDLRFLVSPVSFSSMLTCPRIPDHLMQVPDLTDLALTVLFGGRWHILQTDAQMNIQENNCHCLIQAKCDMNCEATSLARTLSSGLRRKISILRATFRAPRKRFFGPPILPFWALSAVSDEFGHIFRAPENIFRAGIQAPEKGLAEAILGNPSQKKIRGTKNDWSALGMCRLVLSSIA